MSRRECQDHRRVRLSLSRRKRTVSTCPSAAYAFGRTRLAAAKGEKSERGALRLAQDSWAPAVSGAVGVGKKPFAPRSPPPPVQCPPHRAPNRAPPAHPHPRPSRLL